MPQVCRHLHRIDGVCLACGDCSHELILNHCCYGCGREEAKISRPAGERGAAVVPAERLSRSRRKR